MFFALMFLFVLIGVPTKSVAQPQRPVPAQPPTATKTAVPPQTQTPAAPTPTDEILRAMGLTKASFAKAPDFSLRDHNGSPVTLGGYRGSLVLLNFWATWCGPCRDEMPSMENLSRNFGRQDFNVVAINQKETGPRVKLFMSSHGLNFPAPLDSDGRVSAAYRVYGIPVSYLIDGSGNVLGMKSGAHDWSSANVVAGLRKLVADSGSAGFATGSMDLEPTVPLPSVVRAKGTGAVIRALQDPFAEALAKVAPGEDLAPQGKVSGSGETWYLVRSKSGTVGWVRASDVEESTRK